MFEIDVDRFGALDVRPLALVEGTLYVKTSDERLAIDVESGDVVSALTGPYPKAVVGDWVYLSDGTLAVAR